ncbi:hypothetical protein J5U23_01525 [Saccharolobus shibatae B12]|uniref:Uncharacterized protein n=1 Tax=Saccharolobus shibatae (strain ATCC 51178 / DSM 5389 / JCM 8931 / NBRC 15437 / B12) TaxID=523848 RepID=A0A8F5BNS4_SACSH|nr:hypothetical protein J5U23_01525 [Saccharolobus shibatae B12]
MEEKDHIIILRGIFKRYRFEEFYLAALAIKVNLVIKRFYEEHKGKLKAKMLIVLGFYYLSCAVL